VKRKLAFVLTSTLAALAAAACSDDASRSPTAPPTSPEARVSDVERMDAQGLPGGAHVFFARGQAGRTSSSPNMTWHGGPVMHAAGAAAIFWGTSWSGYSGDKISGMGTFYTGFGGSNYAKTNTEYGDGSGNTTSAVSYLGTFVDASPAIGHAPQVSDIVTEVCSALAANGQTPVSSGFYMVYSDQPRGHKNYCAWHSYGSCNGTPIQVAFAFNLDGDPGCDPGAPYAGHSAGLAAIANVSAHELSEALTDPKLNAWYDASGAENADKCAWTFNVASVKLANNSSWKLQGEWSNAAYDAGTGYPNRDGQKGCLSGA
jgi:hypothetical protein